MRLHLPCKKLFSFLCLSVSLQTAALAQPADLPLDKQGKAEESEPKGDSKAGPPPVDPFDFAGSRADSGESEYLELDETIKVRVEPVMRSAVVDRVVENSTIYVKAPGSVRVEIYLEPVDAPFCGKPIAEARMIGQSKDIRRNFPVNWNAVESHRYVKLYALAYKRDGVSYGRSRSIDLSMGGLRLQLGSR